MSVQAMSWVFDHSRAELGARLLLLSVANHADKYGRNSWASVKTLAGEANLSERQARYALRKLEELGEINLVGRYGIRADRLTNIYEMPLMMNEGQILPPDSGHEGQNRTERGANIAPKPSLTVLNKEEGEGEQPPPPPVDNSKGMDWPEEDDWLRDWLKGQDLLRVPAEYLTNPIWWASVGIACHGLSVDFLRDEFAKMEAHLIEHPEKIPHSRNGWLKFIRSWLIRENRWRAEEAKRAAHKTFAAGGLG